MRLFTKIIVLIPTLFCINMIFAKNNNESWKKNSSTPKYTEASKAKNINNNVNENWSDDYSKPKYVTASSIEALEAYPYP